METKSNTEYGGEKNSLIAAGMVSQSCQVCNGDLSRMLYSKISLINLYPTRQPNKAVRICTIINEQSNRPLTCTAFLGWLVGCLVGFYGIFNAKSIFIQISSISNNSV